MEAKLLAAGLVALIAAFFVPSLGSAQESQTPAQGEEQLLVRVELVLESHDLSVDWSSLADAVREAQREAHGRALTVLHVVLPVGGDAVVHVHELRDSQAGASESFVIPRGGDHWLRDALVEHVTRRLVPVRAPSGSLLLSWDGAQSIDAPAGLVEWHVLLVEDGGNLASPPRRS